MSNLHDEQSPVPVKRVYRKKSAEDRAAERQERLMQAALQLFASHGYANTTIEALCSEAKVTTRHFYQAFSGREALLLTLYNEMITALEAGLLTAIALPYSSMQEKLRQMIQALVTHYLTDTRLAQIGVLEVVGASPLIEQRRREAIHGIARYIEVFLSGLAAQQHIPQRNYHWLAVATVGGINELMAEWLLTRQLTLEQLTEEMIFTAATVLRGVMA